MALDAMTRTRIETDSLGSMEIPADAYWGIHTARALENFPISKRPISVYKDLVRGLAMVKQASARANRDIGALDPYKADLIDRASQLVIDGAVPRPVRRGRHPGRCRHLDQHERERGHHQHRARARRPREGRLRLPVADRRHEPQPVHERRLPDGDQGGPRPRPADAAGRAGPAAPGVPGQGGRVPRHPEGRPHPVAGCRADDPRAGVQRLRHDARRGPQPAQGERLPALRDQHGRDRDRHRHHDAPGVRQVGAAATCARSPGSTWTPRPTSSNPPATPARSCRSPRRSSATRSSCRRSATTCGCSRPVRRPGSARSTCPPVRRGRASCPARSTP